jgi:translocation and assembly module TamB
MREAPQSSVQPSSDTIVHREQADEPERRRRIDIDVLTSLGDDIQFAGFGLNAGLNGSVLLRGGTHAPYTGQGKLSLVDGRYKAFGQELVIERGDLVFTGPIEEPILDVLAVRNLRDVRTGIQISGTPSRLSSEIFSDPVMSDAEALAYLLTGRPLADATSTGEEQALDQAAFALGLSGAGLIAAQVRSQLGLETLTIEGLGDESRLIAGKRLGDRLLVEYGYGLVDKLGTLLLRYQLNERLVLESRTGTVSNFDIVYRRRKQ